MGNPLKILGLPVGSSLEEAKASFKALCLKYHPDKNHSPNASKHFISIKNAYDTLEKNPSLLNNTSAPHGDSLSVDIKISAEESYFSTEKIVSIRKTVRCKKCFGSGSEDKIRYICTLCEGTGHISNDILEFLGKESKCQACVGLGITPPVICSVCNGKTIIQAIVKETVPLTYNRRILLNGRGNAGRLKGPSGDLRVQFIVTSGFFYLKNEILTTDIEVSPAQFILGGNLSFKIGEKEVIFLMEKRAKNQIINYLGKPINIIYKILIPAHIDNIENLYREILNHETSLGTAFKQVSN